MDWALSGADALRVAGMMVGALRDVYCVHRVEEIEEEEEAFNAFS